MLLPLIPSEPEADGSDQRQRKRSHDPRRRSTTIQLTAAASVTLLICQVSAPSEGTHAGYLNIQYELCGPIAQSTMMSRFPSAAPRNSNPLGFFDLLFE